MKKISHETFIMEYDIININQKKDKNITKRKEMKEDINEVKIPNKSVYCQSKIQRNYPKSKDTITYSRSLVITDTNRYYISTYRDRTFIFKYPLWHMAFSVTEFWLSYFPKTVSYFSTKIHFCLTLRKIQDIYTHRWLHMSIYIYAPTPHTDTQTNA